MSEKEPVEIKSEGSAVNQPPSQPRLKIAVGVASAGRRSILGTTIDLIARQSRPPDCLVICLATPDDLDAKAVDNLQFSKMVRVGKRGLTAQRNHILLAAYDADVIVFFDDDFFPQPNYLAEIERIFLEHPDVIAVTGRPIEDGINGPGLETETALRLISSGRTNGNREPEVLAPTYGTYGCNMAFRMAPIRWHRLVFDENLPLYGWQEDIDFSRQLAAFGRIVDANVLSGVHLGAKSGRASGIRLGYSQIANPVYLIRKGTMSRAYARPLIWRNVFANLSKSIWPEPWIDRRGRLKGNLLALFDLLTGRISPQRILDLA